GLVTMYEGWEVLSKVKGVDDSARMNVAQNRTTAWIESFCSNACIMAKEGPGIFFGNTTNIMINSESAASIGYQQGVIYA
ncbi:succinate dehydrogenase flavoprotein subunit, partial [Staphylococcus aureus]